MDGPPLVVRDAIKDLILALGERKPILNAKYYFHRRKII
jgi:hypothetical protein